MIRYFFGFVNSFVMNFYAGFLFGRIKIRKGNIMPMRRIFKIALPIALIVLSLGLAVAFFSSTKTTSDNQQQAAPLKSEKQDTSQQDLNKEVFLDVRTPEEWNESHIDGAVFHELKFLQEGIMPDLSKDTPIAIYYRSGRRAEEAKGILEQNGFTNVRNAGGLADLEKNENVKVCGITGGQCGT